MYIKTYTVYIDAHKNICSCVGLYTHIHEQIKQEISLKSTTIHSYKATNEIKSAKDYIVEIRYILHSFLNLTKAVTRVQAVYIQLCRRKIKQTQLFISDKISCMDHNTETNTIRSSKASISCIEVINFYFFSKTFKCDVALFLSPGVISGYWFRLHTQLESASAYLIKAD